MFRRELLDIILDRPVSIHELSRVLGVPVRELDDDLKHLAKSLRHDEYRLDVIPARCRKCGYTFAATKYRKPGKCPQCRGTWLSEPLIGARRKD